jgi:hypothetical protein
MGGEEAEKEDAKPQHPRQDGAYGHVAFAHTPGKCTHCQCPHSRQADHSHQGTDPEDCPTHRTSKRNIGKRLSGECLAPDYDEISDKARNDTESSTRQKSITHKTILEHL